MSHPTSYIWKLMTSLMVFGMVFLLSPQWKQNAVVEAMPGHIPIEALDPAYNHCKGCDPAKDYDECDAPDSTLQDPQDDASSPPIRRPGRFWLNPDAPPPTPSPCLQRRPSQRPNV